MLYGDCIGGMFPYPLPRTNKLLVEDFIADFCRNSYDADSLRKV